MDVTISKEFHWEMGHRLPGHPKCGNPHGHSYRAEIELTGTLDNEGMVLDYGVLSDLMDPLLAQWDHSFMTDETDQLMLDFLAANEFRTTKVTAPSTAENIAGWIADVIVPHLPRNVHTIRVVVRETARAMASVTRTVAN